MSAMTSELTSLTIVYWTVYSGADHKKHQSSASLAFVRGSHRWPVNFHTKASDAENFSIMMVNIILQTYQISHLCLIIKIHENPLTRDGVVLLVDKPTDKQTSDNENIASDGEGNINQGIY